MPSTDCSAVVVIVLGELIEEPPQATNKSINEKTTNESCYNL